MGKPFLWIALDDLAEREKEMETLVVAEQLSGVEGQFGFKINLDYLLNSTMNARQTLWQIQKRFGRPVFADLKMWNGTRTMRPIIEMLVELEVDYLNIYALADELLPGAIQATEGSKTKILGVTVLTHFNEAYCQKHFRRTLRETVRHFAEVAIGRGCHGIILPGTTLGAVRDLKTIKVVPGVRPGWYKDTRHEEEIEPEVAVRQGANGLVCGSPIMKSANRVTALEKILYEMTKS